MSGSARFRALGIVLQVQGLRETVLRGLPFLECRKAGAATIKDF